MSAPALSTAAVHYRIEPVDLHAHLFRVTLTIAQPQALQVLALPVWIPGSYLVREFAKNLQGLQARQGLADVALEQLDKHRWQAACQTGQALVLHYEVYANDPSVRTASLDRSRGFFNNTSLCLRAEGAASARHTLEVVPPNPAQIDGPAWQCATALTAVDIDTQGFGLYCAADYDELVDCPVEMGAFWSGSFSVAGVQHRLVVAGAAPSCDYQRLLADTQKICEVAIRFWHGDGAPPLQNYLFLLHATHNGYGGLEHRHCTALICSRADLPRTGQSSHSEGYTTLLGLISHEYFHTWNVKRLRPAEFSHYDYDCENYTALLWFFEGFTSYYDDLLLHRAGLIDDKTYLKLLNKTIQQVQQTPGRAVQSVAQASWDAWVKYYRQDENTANATVSYYTKGALVALCLDLTLRSEGRTTLDEVMRQLWQDCAAGPMREADLRAVLQRLAGHSFDTEIDAWVHSTAELPLAPLLAAHGLRLQAEPPQAAQRLGLRVSEEHGIRIKTVLRGGLAERAGMAAEDDWLGIEVDGQGWRLQRLADLALYAGTSSTVTALIARGDRLLRLPLLLEDSTAKTADTFSLHIDNAQAATAWLGGH